MSDVFLYLAYYDDHALYDGCISQKEHFINQTKNARISVMPSFYIYFFLFTEKKTKIGTNIISKLERRVKTHL